MNAIEIRHPYFDRVECDDAGCVVHLSERFPIRTFRLALRDDGTGYVVLRGELGFRHEDGAVDWVRGTGETMQDAVMDALLNFVNLVVHPESVSDCLAWREDIP